MGNSKSYIVVGSGVAGGTLCRELLKNEVNSVTLIEAGPKIRMRDYRGWLDLVTRGVAPYNAWVDNGADCENVGPHDLVLRNSRVIAWGGTTLHWEGCCPRLAPEDFKKRSLIGAGMDWPFDHEYLDPYLNRAEELIGVSGDWRSSTVPRTKPFPLPSLQPGIIDRQVIDATERMGWTSEQIPIARHVVPFNGRPACQSTGTCGYCPIGGRFSGDQLTEDLGSNPRFDHLRAAVTRILMRNHREAVAIEYLDLKTGETRKIEADRIVIAAGTIESTKILMASTSREWPQGLGNASGHLGRHLAAHPLLKLRIGREQNPSHISQEIHFPTWCSRQFDSPKEQSGCKTILFPFGGPAVNFGRMIEEGQSISEIKKAVEGPAELLLAGLCEMQESASSRIELTHGKTSLGLPKTRVHFEWEESSLQSAMAREQDMRRLAEEMGWKPIDFVIDQSKGGRIGVRADHATGTCRIATSESEGVVDSNLRVHGTENLWVCSNATIPSPGAANPTLTLAALALRLSDRLRSI